MTFGTASFGTSVSAATRQAKAHAPKPKRKHNRTNLRGCFTSRDTYDCGKFGVLTVREIAAIAGTTRAGIYRRIERGAKGEALCKPRYAALSNIRRVAPPRRHMLISMYKLVRLYPDRLPTTEEIQRIRPMSLQNAQTWRQAIADARAQLQAAGGAPGTGGESQ